MRPCSPVGCRGARPRAARRRSVTAPPGTGDRSDLAREAAAPPRPAPRRHSRQQGGTVPPPARGPLLATRHRRCSLWAGVSLWTVLCRGGRWRTQTTQRYIADDEGGVALSRVKPPPRQTSGLARSRFSPSGIKKKVRMIDTRTRLSISLLLDRPVGVSCCSATDHAATVVAAAPATQPVSPTRAKIPHPFRGTTLAALPAKRIAGGAKCYRPGQTSSGAVETGRRSRTGPFDGAASASCTWVRRYMVKH